MLGLGIDEAIGDRFLETAVNQQVAHALQGHLPFCLLHHRQRGGGFQVRDVVVAVDASHFLDEVFLDGDIETPGGCQRSPTVSIHSHLHAEASQDSTT